MAHNDVRLDHGFLAKRIWRDSPATVKAVKKYARKAQRRQARYEVQKA
jgi:hypothetical protein